MKKLFFIIPIVVFFLSCKQQGKVVKLTWMNREFTDTIKFTATGDTVGLLVETRHFKKYAPIEVKLEDDEILDENGNPIVKTISGIVGRDGFARIVVCPRDVFRKDEVND